MSSFRSHTLFYFPYVSIKYHILSDNKKQRAAYMKLVAARCFLLSLNRCIDYLIHPFPKLTTLSITCPGYLDHPLSKQRPLKRLDIEGRRSERKSHNRNASFETDNPFSQEQLFPHNLP